EARRLSVARGKVWLTLSGTPDEPAQDTWLEAGQAVALAPGQAAVLEGWPGYGARPAEMAQLVSRLEAKVEPFEALDIASVGLAAMEAEADRAREAKRKSDEWEARAAQFREKADAMGKGMCALLSAVAEQEDDGGALEELRGRLEGPVAAREIAEITERAANRIRNAGWRKHLSAGVGDGAGQELTTALRQSLQLLIAGWRQPGLDAAREEARRQATQELARRLEGTLSAFDVMEIASEAVGLLEESAKAAASAEGKQANGAQADMAGEVLRAMRLLLEGLPVTEGDGGGPEKQAIGKLIERLDSPLARFDVLEVVNEALIAVDRQHRTGLERQRRQAEEFQEMIAMLTQTVSALAVQRTASLTRLKQVEKQIEHASQVEDLRVLRADLGECLQAVKECSSQQKQSGETMQVFERHLQAVKSRMKETSDVAESPVQASVASDFYAVFVLDRERGIAARFGEEVRSGVVAFVQQRLKDALAPGDRLVKWKGAAFLALLRRAAPWQDTCAELANMATIPTPPVIEVGSRSIRLPISVSWAVFPQSRYASLELLFEKVDEFIAARKQ
ncbi:MAG: DUF2917 domain-containing protein, partial [Bryobacterales bacterium]|nr:DUF2917 domain-containing protein [Bryobacterales bacterium]